MDLEKGVKEETPKERIARFTNHLETRLLQKTDCHRLVVDPDTYPMGFDEINTVLTDFRTKYPKTIVYYQKFRHQYVKLRPCVWVVVQILIYSTFWFLVINFLYDIFLATFGPKECADCGPTEVTFYFGCWTFIWYRNWIRYRYVLFI